MTLRNKQNALVAAGVLCSSAAVVLAALGAWIASATVFAASSVCGSAAMWAADRRRERLGAAIIRETRRVEEHGRDCKAAARARGAHADIEVYSAIEQAGINLRTATTEAIRHA